MRRPYDIGDKVSILICVFTLLAHHSASNQNELIDISPSLQIALSDPQSDTSASGSSTWFVEKVSLFTTTVRFATTNEVATYSNGSLARLRIINAKRSPKAVLYVYCKFASDVPYKMIKVYQTAIEQFVKSRPREVGCVVPFPAMHLHLKYLIIKNVKTNHNISGAS